MSDNVYLGNPNLKKANTPINFTKKQIFTPLLQNKKSISCVKNLFKNQFKSFKIKLNSCIS